MLRKATPDAQVLVDAFHAGRSDGDVAVFAANDRIIATCGSYNAPPARVVVADRTVTKRGRAEAGRSVRRGVMALAEGLFAAVRNPASHDPLSELGEQEALELLAAWSVLARLVENSTIKQASGAEA